jgi:hypothetical protein
MRDADGAYANCKTVAELEAALGREAWGQVQVGLLGAVRNAQRIEAAQQKVAS